ncbi:HORMA domain-containing protein 1 isoform X1 [Gadus morhua]|nr:HORMA domain-containing protein 1 isoform X1 [Gadus morhua]
MASVQQTRPGQETQLLPDVVATEKQSLIVVKKLLAIAVSSITYLRGLFPEKAYGIKHVEEQKVMILREERSCPGASQIVQWMQGCFDAIQKKYLRKVVLSIYTDPDNPKLVTEFYQFKIIYSAEGPQMEFESNNNCKGAAMVCGNTKKASILLVRKLYTLMQILGPLPDNVCLNMKLGYYDEVTPKDYQPPGFKEGDGNVIEFSKEPVKLCMGEVVTPFHTLLVDVTTERDRLEKVEEEPVRVRDKWMLQMDEQGSVVEQTHMIDNLEKPAEECVKIMDTLMVELESTSTTEEVALMKTRSGRVVSSSTKTISRTKTTKRPSPVQDKAVTQFEFPSSQEVPSAPKKRKFSEPKERY